MVTVATIHQRLRDDHGLVASESSLRRFIWANFDTEVARDAVRVLRDTPPAGEEAQVDYGLLGRWFDPATERMRRVWGFIIVLTKGGEPGLREAVVGRPVLRALLRRRSRRVVGHPVTIRGIAERIGPAITPNGRHLLLAACPTAGA